MPLHETTLKLNCPIILLRNLNPQEGLCNGTRMIVTAMAEWVIEAQILTGTHAGRRAFIPRISSVPQYLHVDRWIHSPPSSDSLFDWVSACPSIKCKVNPSIASAFISTILFSLMVSYMSPYRDSPTVGISAFYCLQIIIIIFPHAE